MLLNNLTEDAQEPALNPIARRALMALGLGAMLVLATPVRAQDIVEEMQRCAELQSDMVRLACYDAVMTAWAGAVEKDDGAEPDSVTDRWQAASRLVGGDFMKLESWILGEVDGLSEGKQLRLRNGEVWRQNEDIDIDYRTMNPRVEISEDLLGRYEMRLEGLNERITVRLVMVETRVDGEVDGLSKGTRIMLRNGQIWRQDDEADIEYSATNPRVDIRRGLLGSYRMRLEGLDERIRVRRVQ